MVMPTLAISDKALKTGSTRRSSLFLECAHHVDCGHVAGESEVSVGNDALPLSFFGRCTALE
jgi:hypothetical protein